MKYGCLFILFLLHGQVHGQDYSKFVLTKDGVEPIVVQFDSMSAPVLYAKAYKWVQKSYKNPEKVLKTNLQGEEIRVEAYKEGAFFYKQFGKPYYFDIEYSFTIQLKDKKIRLIYTPSQIWTSLSSRALFSYSSFFKKTGELKDVYRDAKPSMEQTMNDLVKSLCDYLNNKTSGGDW